MKTFIFILLTIIKTTIAVSTTTTSKTTKKTTAGPINWNGNDWAMSCDWVGNDFTSALSTGAQCGPLCKATFSCTHFTWTTLKNGTCWMKTGYVTINDAFNTNDYSMVCGYNLNSVRVPPLAISKFNF